MKFKLPSMQLYFKSDRLHPDVRRAAIDFEHWCAVRGFPEPLISDLQRSKLELFAYYLKYYRKLQAADESGHVDGLSAEERLLARSLRGESDADLRRRAESRNSWHCGGCAADFSQRPFTPHQREEINAYFESKYGQNELWEYRIDSVVGDLPHFHLGRRDFEFRAKIEQGVGNV